MDNRWTPPSAKPLKSRLCSFCAFVRGRGGNTLPYTHADAGPDTPVHNNKYNNNIYISGVEGASCPPRGVA